MTTSRIAAALVFGLLAAPAFAPSALAHGPTPQQLSRSVEIKAAPEAVWETLRDPASFGVWHPDAVSVSMEGEGRGAKRTVDFAGGAVTDGIDDVNDERKLIRWRLSTENHAALPVSFYTHTLTVSPAGEGSKVDWRASFFRADTTNEPVESLSDAAAVAAMEAYADHGLAGLKAALEGAGEGSH